MLTRKMLLNTTCFAVACFMTSVMADELNDQQPSLTVGIGVQNAPKYSGSDDSLIQFAPVVQARNGAFFFDSLKGVGYDLQNSKGLYLEHTIGYGLGRKDRDSSWREGSDKLKGMGNIKATINTSVAVGWYASSWFSLEGKAILPLTDSQGAQYQTSVTLLPWQDDKDTVSLQSAALFGDARYMETMYGVNDKQSEANGYASYQASGGFYGVKTDLTWSHQFSSNWSTAVSGGYTWLGDHAADSPIVQRRNQTTVSAGVLYTF